MSSFTTAEVREMVDDLDDIIRASVVNGDVETVFAREKGNFDKIMRAKRENKNNADVYREFCVTRYLWSFCEQWIRAKKAGQLAIFWGAVRKSKERYDNENPSGRRAQPLSPPSAVHQGKSPSPPVPNPTSKLPSKQSKASGQSLPKPTSAGGPKEHRPRLPLPMRSLSKQTKAPGQPLTQPNFARNPTMVGRDARSNEKDQPLTQPKFVRDPKSVGRDPQSNEQRPNAGQGASISSNMFFPPHDNRFWHPPATQETNHAMRLADSAQLNFTSNFSPPSTRAPIPQPRSPPRAPGPSTRLSPRPVPGPSTIPARKPTGRRSVSSTSSLPSSYIEGHRIPYKNNSKEKSKAEPEFVVPDDFDMGNDSDEYQPSIKVKHVKPEAKKPEAKKPKVEKPKVEKPEVEKHEDEKHGDEKHKHKGKGKMKMDVRKSDTRMRKEPVNTRKLRMNACARCVRLKMDCFAQLVGSACFGCAMVKVKCDEEGGKPTNKTRVKKERKRPIKPPATREKSARRPIRIRDDDELSTATASSTPASNASADISLRRAISKITAAPPPGGIEELRKEVQRQREIIDAVVPGYIRLKDKVAEMDEKIDRRLETITGAIFELEDTTKSHRQKISNIFQALQILKRGLERMDESSESDDESVQIIERPNDVKMAGDERKWENIEENIVIHDLDEEMKDAKEDVENIEQVQPAGEEINIEQVQPAGEESVSANSARGVTQLDCALPALGLDVRESSVGMVDVPEDMPPPQSPPTRAAPSNMASPPPPPISSPPPLPPAVTLQPPTPLTSQEGVTAEPAKLLDVPATGVQDPDGTSSDDAPKGHSRSASQEGSEPRRSPRLHSRSPSPLPSSIPAKRSADDSANHLAPKRGRKK